MSTAIPLTRTGTGQIATGHLGFSWTTLFFGPVVPLMRGHWAAFFVMLLGILLFPIPWLIFPFVYNKWHLNWLTGRGYLTGGHAPQASWQPVNITITNTNN